MVKNELEMDLVCVRELFFFVFLTKVLPFSGFLLYFEFRRGAELSSCRKKPIKDPI